MSMAVVVTLSSGEPPAICERDGSVNSFESEGESFGHLSEYGDWLGFYDWLRTDEGAIIGVRVRVDDQKVIQLFERYKCPSVTIEGGVVTIRTSSDGVVCEVQSDDSDFGGNAIFAGSEGSLAIAFFFPRKGKLFA